MKKYMIVYESVKKDIVDGYLKKGDKLSSIRGMSKIHKVSITSIQNAYDRLLREGYIQPMPRSGYFVCMDQEEANTKENILQVVQSAMPKISYNFSENGVDEESFDMQVWKKYMRIAMDNMELLSMYGEAQGEEILRKALAKHLYEQRRVLCTHEEIVVSSNYQSLLHIVCGLLAKKCVVGVDENGYEQAMQVFKDHHFEVCCIAYEGDFLNLKQLYECDILYINSASFSKQRKGMCEHATQQLQKYAQEHYVIEDDYNGQLRYVKDKQDAVHLLCRQRIIYMSSFSKVLMPSLRISYMVLPPTLLKLYRQRVYSPASSKVEQLTLAYYMLDGHFQRHMKRLLKIYKAKNEAMLKSVKKYFHDNYIFDECGLLYLIEIDASIQKKLQDTLARRGVLLLCNKGYLRLSFSFIHTKDIDAGLKCVKECLDLF